MTDTAFAPLDTTISIDQLVMDPYPIYRRLRAESPVLRVKSVGRTLLTKAEDTKAVKDNPVLFSSNDPNTPMKRAFLAHTLMRKDGAEHLRERNAMAPAFSAKTIQTEWIPRYREIAAEYLDRLPKGEVVDLFSALAGPYAALGLVEDAEYWFETFRSQWDEKGPPLAETYYFAAQGAGLRWLSADLEKAASLIDSEGPYDAPYLLSYGGLAWIQAGNAQKGVEWLERGIGFYQNEMVPDDPADAIDFPLQNVFVMDGSKRSGKGNAFFTGFGRNRRIVLFDTLIKQHDRDELVAILAHEMGHYKKHHVHTGLIAAVAQTGAMFFVLSLCIAHPALFAAFYMPQPSIYAGLVLFGLLYAPVDFFTGILSMVLSRRNEYAADRFAIETTGNGEFTP